MSIKSGLQVAYMSNMHILQTFHKQFLIIVAQEKMIVLPYSNI